VETVWFPLLFSLSESLAEFRRRNGENKTNQFSPATCASEKTPLTLQTYKLFAIGERFVRCSKVQP